MRKITAILVAAIAALHIFIAWFEMSRWETLGPKIFKTFPPDLFPQTVAMAANQGLYNGFLAAGLIWSLMIKDVKWQRNVATCFLIFVAVAGLYAGNTISPTVILVQTVPALLALLLLYLLPARAEA